MTAGAGAAGTVMTRGCGCGWVGLSVCFLTAAAVAGGLGVGFGVDLGVGFGVGFGVGLASTRFGGVGGVVGLVGFGGVSGRGGVAGRGGPGRAACGVGDRVASKRDDMARRRVGSCWGKNSTTPCTISDRATAQVSERVVRERVVQSISIGSIPGWLPGGFGGGIVAELFGGPAHRL
ncbi:MAG: hypothetical protein DVS81_10660 [Candidatus Accumulibacter meliphilus]|uniref:Uncharacterized protein n=1 Tax=Candidatus Accumulibacter meliphilus TaxID=2211374 RepID=A0A369XQX3_9PROT|nr:MAG: hypothetical protein DVS81_10660 [Candidatus Accumulibacter meliphilus]